MRRYLKGNAGTEVPASIFFVDTETRRKQVNKSSKTFIETFRMGFVRHVRLRENRVVDVQEMAFWNLQKFWNFLYSSVVPRRSNWVFAHNLSFDAQVLRMFDEFSAGRLSIFCRPRKPDQPSLETSAPGNQGAMFQIDGLPCFIKARTPRATVLFVDTMNYFRLPLWKIGENLGISKGKMPGDKATRDEWETYCKRDVDILHQLMLPIMQRWKELELGNWSYTAAGLAFNNFRHSHAPMVIKANGKEAVNICLHDDDQAKELERHAYHGGEIGCFYTGIVSPEKPQFDPRPWTDDYLHHLDCRSLFPFAMQNGLYPVALEKFYGSMNLPGLRRAASAKAAIAEVYLETPTLPFVCRHDGKVRYSVGNFWTVLCGDELGRALKEDLVRDVGRVAVYQLGDIFRKYVRYWYGQREKAIASNDHNGNMLAKMLLNSLYGKFGQKSQRWIDAPNVHPEIQFGQFMHLPLGETKFQVYRSVAGYVQQRVESVDGKNSFCAIASFVTANAREYMRRVREICPYRSIYYQHTDSLICSHAAYLAIKRAGLIGPKLGQFRELEESSSYAEFYGPGDYIFGRRQVQSGTKPDAIKIGSELVVQDEFNGLSYQVAHGPSEGVIGQTKEIARNRDRWKLYQESNGWAEPHKIITPRLPAGMPALLCF